MNEEIHRGGTAGRVEGGVYTIERLIAKRTRLGRVSYLVRGSGWAEADDGWVPAEDIEQSAIDQFEEARRASERAPAKCKARRKPKPKRKATPFTVTASKAEDDEVRARRAHTRMRRAAQARS